MPTFREPAYILKIPSGRRTSPNSHGARKRHSSRRRRKAAPRRNRRLLNSGIASGVRSAAFTDSPNSRARSPPQFSIVFCAPGLHPGSFLRRLLSPGEREGGCVTKKRIEHPSLGSSRASLLPFFFSPLPGRISYGARDRFEVSPGRSQRGDPPLRARPVMRAREFAAPIGSPRR